MLFSIQLEAQDIFLEKRAHLRLGEGTRGLSGLFGGKLPGRVFPGGGIGFLGGTTGAVGLAGLWSDDGRSPKRDQNSREAALLNNMLLLGLSNDRSVHADCLCEMFDHNWHMLKTDGVLWNVFPGTINWLMGPLSVIFIFMLKPIKWTCRLFFF